MTDPVAPDWVIRTASFPPAHQEPASIAQPQGLDQTKVDNFLGWRDNLAGKDGLAAGTVPVSGTGVSGTVSANAVAIAPATSVAVQTTNMLVSQDFTSQFTISAGDTEWSWDGTDGNIIPGCARVDCDGHQRDLVSNEIAVITGETIEVACQVKWSGLVYGTSNPIILGVEKYRQGRAINGGITYLDLGGFDIDSVESPAADSDWVGLAGTYVVQPGVDQLRFRFRADKAITSGVVKWDEAIFLKLDLIDDNAVPGVGETVDNIVTRLYGTTGSGFTHNQSAVALANTAASLLSVNARLAALEAEGSTGTIAGDDFIFSGEITANSNWGGAYSDTTLFNGSYAGNGTDAEWIPAGVTPNSTTQTGWFDWEGVGDTSTTDYQLIQLVLTSTLTSASTSFAYNSYIHLLGRISPGFASYVRASIGSDGTYVIDYWDGSSFTVMDSGFCVVPGAGSLISFYCGDKATLSPRHFKLSVNSSSAISDFTEVGAGSPLGASNRKWGWGGKAEGGLVFLFFVGGFPSQAVLPTVNQWLGYDQ